MNGRKAEKKPEIVTHGWERRGIPRLIQLTPYASPYLHIFYSPWVFDCKRLQQYQLDKAQDCLGMVYLPNRDQIAAVYHDNTLNLWDCARLTPDLNTEASPDRMYTQQPLTKIELTEPDPFLFAQTVSSQCNLIATPNESKLFLLSRDLNLLAEIELDKSGLKKTMVIKDFNKKIGWRDVDVEVLSSSFIEPHYLAVILRTPYAAYATYARPNLTSIWLYDTTQKDYLNKSPCMKFEINNLVHFQAWPGGNIWAFTTYDRVLTICQFVPEQPLKIIARMTMHAKCQADPVIVGEKIYFSSPVDQDQNSQEARTGISCFDLATCAVTQFYDHPGSILGLLDTSRGLCVQDHEFRGLHFFPGTLEFPRVNPIAVQSIVESTRAPRGVAEITAGYAGFFNYTVPTRLPRAEKNVPGILEEIDNAMKKFQPNSDAKDNDPKKLICADLKKLRKLIEENKELSFSACVAQCEYLKNYRAKEVSLTRLWQNPAEDALGELLQKIRVMDAYEVIKFSRG